MNSRQLSLSLISFFVCFTAGRQFRFDYTYYPDIEGWLKLHSIPATWRDAWLRCDLEGSVLASPINVVMRNYMDVHFKAKNSNGCAHYTGVHATFSKGDFSSIEGVSLAKMPLRWAVGEPDNADNNEDCIVLTNGTIADVNCSDLFPYMCFRKKSKDMVVTPCGTVDQVYELSPVTGNCYKFHRQGQTWQRAYMTCVAEGGYLAVINSNDEALVLKNIFDKYYAKILPGTNRILILVGIHDWGEHGVWRTIHGTTIEEAGYANWNQSQPDNKAPGQYCGAMFRDTKLDDYWCNRTGSFICEKSPDSLVDDDFVI